MSIRFHVAPRCLKAFSYFAAKDIDKKPKLCGVRCEVTNEGVTLIATDGAKLLALRLPHAEGVTTDFGEFTIPIELLAHLPDPTVDLLLGALPPINPEARVSGLEVVAEGGKVSIVGRWAVSGVPASDDYPNWRQVVPSDFDPSEGLTPPRFSAAQLAAFCEAAGNLFYHDAIEIYHGGLREPSLISFPYVPNMVGVLMPMAAKDETPTEPVKIPDWARFTESPEEGDQSP